MKFIVSAGVFICVGVLALTNVRAEPTPSVRALMNEPVSLFSFGLHKLDLTIKHVIFSNLKGISSVGFDWKANRITLGFREVEHPGVCNYKNDKNCQSVCRRQYKQIRELLCIGEDCKVFNSFPAYFSHVGYSQGEITESLKDVTEVSVRLRLKADSSVSLVCEGPITREEPSFRVATN